MARVWFNGIRLNQVSILLRKQRGLSARAEKYNQLLRIEAELGDTAKCAGWAASKG
ncbi:MAG: hypothetical protein IT314_07125 [Anaerolineales bacterium]|nr:hypothetical protein [Anaerolineales bacterium]